MKFGLITTISIAATLILATIAICTTMVTEPGTIAYQATLTDNNGQVLTGTKSIRTCLYNSPITAAGLPGPPDNGSAFWCQTYPNVTLKSGQFSLVLGNYTSSNTLKPKFKNFSSGNVFIGVKVGSTEPEIPQRQKLSSVAYAVNSYKAENGSPPGMVSAFAGIVAPRGWLLCNGAAVSRTTYSDLFAVIGTSHGVGDGTTTFNLPDYGGRFLRGVNGTVTRDIDASSRSAMNPGGVTGNAVGSVQGENYKSHNHGVTDPTHNHVVVDSGHSHWMSHGCSGGCGGSGLDLTLHGSFPGDYYTWASTSNISLNAAATGLSVNVSGGAETRPINASVNWIIKY